MERERRFDSLLRFVDSRLAFVVVIVAISIVATGVSWSVDRLGSTDDLIFLQSIREVTGTQTGLDSLATWISWRYVDWSGRIVPEFLIWALSPAPIELWRALSVVVWVSTVLLSVRLFDLVYPSARWAARSGIAILSFCALFLMDPDVVLWAAFWVTGALNYWWIVPFALAAALPFVEVLFRRTAPGVAVIVVATLAAWVAAVSNEQVSAIVVVLALIATARHIVQLRSGDRAAGTRGTIAIVAPTLGAVIGAIILFAAPGNAHRAVITEEVWLPGFTDAPLTARLLGGIQFSLDGIVNQSGLILALIWLGMLVIVLRSGRRDWFAIVSGAVAIAAISAFVGSRVLGIERLSAFSPAWMTPPDGAIGWAVLVAWTVILLATAAFPYVIRRDLTGALQSLLVVAAYASAFVNSFAPSMYVSGPRVFFIPTVALAIVLISMLPLVLRDRRPFYWVASTAPAVGIAGVSAVALVAQIASLT